jgi:hypothetical protein
MSCYYAGNMLHYRPMDSRIIQGLESFYSEVHHINDVDSIPQKNFVTDDLGSLSCVQYTSTYYACDYAV